MLGPHLMLHSQLSIGRQGALACGQRLLLRQGENDMACGHHCVLMALMLLGVVQRDALYDEGLDERLNESLCHRAIALFHWLLNFQHQRAVCPV